MFTGIIEEVGHLIDKTRLGIGEKLIISAPGLSPTLGAGDSIAVDGVCVTVEREGNRSFEVTVGPQTLARTEIGNFTRGRAINLERAVTAGGRFGGHFVQGHVDSTTEVLRRESVGEFARLTFRLPPEGASAVIEKGSVAVNGVSVTVSRIDAKEFSVDLIPYTLDKTNLASLNPGDAVNIEYDMIGKYVEKLLRRKDWKRGIDHSFLQEHGFTTGGET